MFAGTVIFATITYIVMLVAFSNARYQSIHRPVMASIILIDIFFPFYLYLTRDWFHRLIEQGEIFSFLIWMHLILVITLYMLYVMQVMAAKKIINGDLSMKKDHRSQGLGILITRALVIITGAL